MHVSKVADYRECILLGSLITENVIWQRMIITENLSYRMQITNSGRVFLTVIFANEETDAVNLYYRIRFKIKLYSDYYHI